MNILAADPASANSEWLVLAVAAITLVQGIIFIGDRLWKTTKQQGQHAENSSRLDSLGMAIDTLRDHLDLNTQQTTAMANLMNSLTSALKASDAAHEKVDTERMKRMEEWHELIMRVLETRRQK